MCPSQGAAGLTSHSGYGQQTYASITSQGASQQGHAHQESHDSRVTQTCDSTDLRPFTLADDEDEHPPSAHTVQS